MPTANYDLSDVTSCQNMVQGYFMMRAVNNSRLLCSKCRNSCLCRHSLFGAPQIPNNKISPTSKQRPRRTAHWGQCLIESKQPLSTNARCPAWDPSWTTIYLTPHRVSFVVSDWKWFQWKLFNTNNSIQHYQFVCTPLIGSMSSRVRVDLGVNEKVLYILPKF